MNGFSLTTGQVFKIDGAKFRIDRTLDNGSITLENCETLDLVRKTRQEILEAYAEGRVVAVPRRLTEADVPSNESALRSRYGRPFCELKKSVQVAALRRKAYVDLILSNGRPSYTPKILRPFILKVAQTLNDKKPPSPTTVYRWCEAIGVSNDPRRLIPRHDLKGPRKPRTNQKVIDLFMESIVEEAAIACKLAIKNVEDRLSKKISQTNHFLPANEHLQIPNTRTLYRLFDRVPEYDITLLNEGKSAADRRYRIVRRGVQVSRVLERVEVDHTPFDVFLVDERTWLPCGRPTLTMLIDVFSRMPLGYYISFDDTSTLAVMRAVRHALLPKKPARAVVPNLTVQNPWPCFGRFEMLVCDNGLEFHSDSLAAACFDLQMQLLFCPKKQPQFKGVIERFLKTCNYSFAHRLPGTSLAHFSARGDYDPLTCAVLTISEFTHLFEKWLLDVYAQTVHKGIGTTPSKKWEEGIVGVSQKLPASAEEIALHLGIYKRRSLRHDGVLLNGLYYASDDLLPIISTYGIGVRVRVAYDPEDLGSIWLWAPDGQEKIRVPAVQADYANGLRLAQHRLIRKYCRDSEESGEHATSLMEARIEIAEALSGLANSKHLRQRRKAAKALGVSNENPSGNATPSPPPPQKSLVMTSPVNTLDSTAKLNRIQRNII
ncbi:Mu transposase C-terminal domain-containing protein [Burkholderia anthinoferrum]|uniref:Mu transposase C-terminal domain-containing protein n=1 Tax=Burkholderia anthinoferrum TaxID=3090833 RepID=UPI0015E28391|nr:Mu transposase C-terminal domain-containing protein [Burkholderia anthinoferrum]